MDVKQKRYTPDAMPWLSSAVLHLPSSRGSLTEPLLARVTQDRVHKSDLFHFLGQKNLVFLHYRVRWALMSSHAHMRPQLAHHTTFIKCLYYQHFEASNLYALPPKGRLGGDLPRTLGWRRTAPPSRPIRSARRAGLGHPVVVSGVWASFPT